MLALSLLSISVHGTSCKERGLPGGASHLALSYDLAHIGWQGRKQDVVGPLQDDEALLMFALSRALGVNRVLEIGSLNGASARNFLSAVSVSVLGPRNWVPARSTSDATRTQHTRRVCHMSLSASAGALYASCQGVLSRPFTHRACAGGEPHRRA